jgi:spore maturation protein CgeB
MNYRFVKVTSYYRAFLDDYYIRNNNILYKPYDEHLAGIMEEGFGWADFFQRHLTELGIEAYEIIFNADQLQKQWAVEHGLSKSGEALLLEQLKHLKPEIIFFQDSLSFSKEFIKSLKKEISTLKKIIGWCCSPFNADQLQNFKYFDFNFGCSEKFIGVFKKNNIKAYELNHAFESSLLNQINIDNNYPEPDLIFIGSFILNSDFHDLRLKILEELLDKNIGISIYANLKQESFLKLKLRQGGYILSHSLAAIGLKEWMLKNNSLKKSYHLKDLPKRGNFSKKFLSTLSAQPLFGKEMLKAISKSKIGFNSHGGVAGDYAANSRMFEVTGVGSCLLTDHKKNIGKFFQVDKEIITYNSAEDCIEKVKWLLNHPAERKEIAASGQQKTLKDHTFKQRAAQLNEIILSELK